MELPQQLEELSGWVTLRADNGWEATVAAAAVPRGTHLANLVSLSCDAAGGSAPAVRLDCSAAVADEVVALLRQGARRYRLPDDDRRLLRATQHTLDVLGLLPAGCVPRAAEPQEVILVPSYWYMGLNSSLDPRVDPQEAGLLMYSSSARGWANRCGAADPRPQDVRGCGHPHSGGGCWLAAVLRSEATGAGARRRRWRRMRCNSSSGSRQGVGSSAARTPLNPVLTSRVLVQTPPRRGPGCARAQHHYAVTALRRLGGAAARVAARHVALRNAAAAPPPRLLQRRHGRRGRPAVPAGRQQLQRGQQQRRRRRPEQRQQPEHAV